MTSGQRDAKNPWTEASQTPVLVPACWPTARWSRLASHPDLPGLTLCDSHQEIAVISPQKAPLLLSSKARQGKKTKADATLHSGLFPETQPSCLSSSHLVQAPRKKARGHLGKTQNILNLHSSTKAQSLLLRFHAENSLQPLYRFTFLFGMS